MLPSVGCFHFREAVGVARLGHTLANICLLRLLLHLLQIPAWSWHDAGGQV